MGRWAQIFFLASLAGLAACQEGQECTAAADCFDGDICTEDRCRLERCSWLRIPGCCTGDGDCGAGASCNRDSNRCLGGAPLGVPCREAGDCESGVCLTETGNGFPGGYCGSPCQAANDCPSGLCLPLGDVSTCLSPCSTDADCRPEYLCLVFGPGLGGCFPHCTEAAHCPQAGSCNHWWGFCGPEGAGEPNGAACAGDGVCRGILCIKEAESGAPGGLCASLCSAGRTYCPGAGEACVALWSPIWGLPACLPLYRPESGCRESWTPLIAWNFETQSAVAVCQPACQAEGCSSEKPCDPWSGLCGADPDQRRELGEPCAEHQDCRGLCMNFWPGGYCTAPCRLPAGDCPGGGRCVDLGAMTTCLAPCQADSDCRGGEGYLCHPQLQVCAPS